MNGAVSPTCAPIDSHVLHSLFRPSVLGLQSGIRSLLATVGPSRADIVGEETMPVRPSLHGPIYRVVPRSSPMSRHG